MARTNTKDRRRSERVTLWSPVQLVAPDGAAPAALKNLSVAGLCCTTSRVFPELSLVKIQLDLPSGEDPGAEHVRLELSGAVVRCEPLRHGTGKRRFEVALYFTDLTPKARQSLSDLVRQRLA
jgi:hypothetical protein